MKVIYKCCYINPSNKQNYINNKFYNYIMAEQLQYYTKKKEDIEQLIYETKHMLHFLESELRDIEDFFEQVNN